VNFWQIWLELGSRYSGFKDQREPAETGQRGCFFGSWAFAARANLDVFCEGRLSCPTEEKAQQLHARDECVLSISTDSLSITAEEKRCCTKPLSAPAHHRDSKMDGRAISAKERHDKGTAHHEIHTATFL